MLMTTDSTEEEHVMGEFVEHTHEQRHEHDRRQKDPKFLAWLDGMDDELARVVGEDAPALESLPPQDRWSLAGLRVLERAALEHFPTVDVPEPSQEQIQLLDRLARAVGYVFARTFEGAHWVYVVPARSADEPGEYQPVVETPALPVYVNPGALLVQAVYGRKGTVLEQVYASTEKDHAAWVAAGRPPLREWEEMMRSRQ